MSVRYRKRINLGGGFRINLSKSGIGYSWGTKGYRITKTARGTVRQTVSIPGTGLSHVSESKKGRRDREQQPTQPQEIIETYDAKSFENADAREMVSAAVTDILETAKRTSILNIIAIILMIGFLGGSSQNPWSLIPLAASIALFVYVRTKGIVYLEYDLSDDESQAQWNRRMATFAAIAKSEKLWRITQSRKIADQKKNSGASTAIARKSCTYSKKLPFPFRSNVECVAFHAGKEKLIFLPDMLIVKQGGKTGALSYDDFSFHFSQSNFIESDSVPKDAEIVGHTWKYVNKSGGPDKRFKGNKELPICKYGRLHFTSDSGLNTVIMYSNANAGK